MRRIEWIDEGTERGVDPLGNGNNVELFGLVRGLAFEVLLGMLMGKFILLEPVRGPILEMLLLLFVVVVDDGIGIVLEEDLGGIGAFVRLVGGTTTCGVTLGSDEILCVPAPPNR